MPSWDPDQYLRFAEHRTRPAHDLLARVTITDPDVVVDVGCGPGNSTSLLARRWPAASLIGLDSSEEMLNRARETLTRARFIHANLAEWQPDQLVGVVFANATLQWVDDHSSVLTHLVSWLAPGGFLAVQMPTNFDQPSHAEMRRLANSARWQEQVGGVLRERPVLPAEEYARLLNNPGSTVDVWVTEYLHVLTGPDPVVAWVRGTGLRPVLDRLDPQGADEFLHTYAAAMREAYPPERDGTTLFPFRRLFIVCRRD